MLNDAQHLEMPLKRVNEKVLLLSNHFTIRIHTSYLGEILMLQIIKEYEVHSSDNLIYDYKKSLDEIFREAAQDGSLYE